MSAISLKSITGITSITTPAGVDNVFTVHTNDTTERFKIDEAGNVRVGNTFDCVGVSTFRNNLFAQSDLRISGEIVHLSDDDTRMQFPSNDTIAFKTAGSERLRINSSGNVTINRDLDVDGHTNLDNVSIAGVTTITGSGNALEIVGGLVRSRNTTSARFVANNGSAEGYFGWSSGVLTVGQAAATLSLEATGSNHIQLKTNGNERLRIKSDGRTQIKSGDFEVIGGEGGNAEIRLTADEGDDGADYWRFQSAASGNNLNIATYASGAWVEKLRISSAGNLTVTGSTSNLFSSNSYNVLELRADENNDGGNDDIILKFTHDGTFRSEMRYDESSSTLELSTSDNRGDLVIASNGKVTMTTGTNNLRGLAVIAPKTQINFGTQADKGGFLMSEANGQFGISGGGYWSGSNWNATHTGSAQIRHDGAGIMVFCTNTSLTSGNTFTPTERLRIAANGSVGVNINNPQSYDPGARALVVGEVDGYGHTGITLRSNGTDKQGAIYFADGTGSASYRGRVEYRHDTDTLGLGAGGSGYMYELTSDRHLQSQNFCINSNVASTSSTKYSQINSDNHGNTFFGLNCHLGNNGSGSGNHTIVQSNSHGTIGCAGILMGGNGSNNNSRITFFAFGQGNSAGHNFGQDAWKVRINRSGDVMEVKTTQNSGNAGMIVFRDGNNDYCGQITSNGASNTSNFVSNSDYRLKTNVLSITDGITRVKNLKPYQFEWKSELGTKVDGFFAHEAQTVVPESVVGTKDEVDSDGKPKYQGIDQAKLVPLLTAALQEAITEIETLKTKVAVLEGS